MKRKKAKEKIWNMKKNENKNARKKSDGNDRRKCQRKKTDKKKNNERENEKTKDRKQRNRKREILERRKGTAILKSIKQKE